MYMFRNLSEAEVATYKKWARDHYHVFEPIQGVWHPVVQLECVQMNIEAGCDPKGASCVKSAV